MLVGPTCTCVKKALVIIRKTPSNRAQWVVISRQTVVYEYIFKVLPVIRERWVYDAIIKRSERRCYDFDSGVFVSSQWSSWSHHFESFTVATMTWLTITEYMCHKWHRICRNHSQVLSLFMTYHRNKINVRENRRVTRHMPHAEQERLTFPGHMSPPQRSCCSIFSFLCNVL